MVRSLRLSHFHALASVLMIAAVIPASAAGPLPDPGAGNVLPLTMRTPRSGYNRMVVDVTLCAPGTSRCATIGDVMVDTGSTGLRLEASAVPSWLGLPAFLGPSGKPLAECLRFVHDDAWGPLVRADLRLGGLAALNVPIQIIADAPDHDDFGLNQSKIMDVSDPNRREHDVVRKPVPPFRHHALGPQPATCPVSQARPTANGTLGIGPHLFDCAGPCTQDPARPGVFESDAGSWVPVTGRVDEPYRLPNPVTRLPGHNNGFVVDLPRPEGGGAEAVSGTLTFGVGTAADNRLGSARIVRIDALGHFTTLYGRRSYLESYIDSGTPSSILEDDRLPRCEGMTWAFCAVPERSLPAVLVDQDGAAVPVRFTVGDYRQIRASGLGASDAVAVAAERGSRAFVWGAPFFLGRRVFVVLDRKSVPGFGGAEGPFYAVP